MDKPIEDGYLLACFGIATTLLTLGILFLMFGFTAVVFGGMACFGVLATCIGVEVYCDDREAVK